MCHPKGRSAAKDARSALTRRPARSYSAPTIPATVRHARRRSGERHERSIPRPPALPAPLADPPIAPQPTHTRLRRAPKPRANDLNRVRTVPASARPLHSPRCHRQTVVSVPSTPPPRAKARRTPCSLLRKQTNRRLDLSHPRVGDRIRHVPIRTARKLPGPYVGRKMVSCSDRRQFPRGALTTMCKEVPRSRQVLEGPPTDRKSCQNLRAV